MPRMDPRHDGGRLVYSTRAGGVCPKCARPAAGCICGQAPRGTGDGVVRVSRETKGRKGKGVTVITGIPLVGEEIGKLALELIQRCGAGGTVKGGVIEIQGDHRDLVLDLLKARGWTVKRAGG